MDPFTSLAIIVSFASLAASVVALRRVNQRLTDVREHSEVNRVRAEMAELHDTVDRVAISLGKLRNRANADNARAKKKGNLDSLTDDEWRREMNRRLALSQAGVKLDA